MTIVVKYLNYEKNQAEIWDIKIQLKAWQAGGTNVRKECQNLETDWMQ